MQENAILLGGPWHGRMVPIRGYVFQCMTANKIARGFYERCTYTWEYRGGDYLGPSPGTIFGVYVKPKEQS